MSFRNFLKAKTFKLLYKEMDKDKSFLLEMLNSDNLTAEEKLEAQELWAVAVQNHHDYYVAFQRTGRLTENDAEDFALAMMREENGEVKPLPEGAEIAILEELDSLLQDLKEGHEGVDYV